MNHSTRGVFGSLIIIEASTGFLCHGSILLLLQTKLSKPTKRASLFISGTSAFVLRLTLMLQRLQIPPNFSKFVFIGTVVHVSSIRSVAKCLLLVYPLFYKNFKRYFWLLRGHFKQLRRTGVDEEGLSKPIHLRLAYRSNAGFIGNFNPVSKCN